MKTIITSAAIALSLLAVPAAAQQVRGLEAAIAHFNKTEDAPNDRIQIRSSRLDSINRSSRTSDLSRAARRAFDINNRSAETSTERRVLPSDTVGNQGFTTQRSGSLSRAARIAIDINNRSADTSTERRIITR
ncbi:MAG: hypothetical protein AAGF30_07795 [Pseudomonadota bacterium]